MALNSAFTLSGLLATAPEHVAAPAERQADRKAPDVLHLASTILKLLNAQPNASLPVLDLLKELSKNVDLSLDEYQNLLERLSSMGWIAREGDRRSLTDYRVRALKR